MLLSWAYDGVNGSVPRNTGPECADYLSPVRKLVETMVIIPLCLIAIKCAVSRLKPIAYQQMDRFSGSPFSGNRTLSTSNYNLNNLNYQRNMVEQEPRDLLMPHHRERSFSSASIASGIVEDIHCQRCLHPSATPVRGMAFPVDFSVPSWGKQFLLVTMTLTLGVELGFKFATRTVIYILNPCHITTIMQIYLLACNKSTKSSTVLFRLQMNYLNGPLLAFMFPETDSRQLPLESSIYWIQHALMCIIPIFLLKSGGVYNMEPLNDFTWNVIGYATLILYHFGILQVIASPVQVNLNHMLCPALKDPFEGSNYRVYAVFHEAILCTLLCKIITFLFSPLPSPIINRPPFIKNGKPTDVSTVISAAAMSTSTSLPPHLITSSRPSSRSSSPAKASTILQENNIIIKTSKID
ncbi:transmembrane protein 164 isoform X1 [Anopheles gambiae]|nr:transmembrane protein 164 isoform X1 [Anopheles gambiae]XP_061514676.1 transmembrane protein 164 isoform X1 [Anopheles gambiae]XP_061514677.1 transmembrane protein 164 isoform X1 [Anopheles gambiae]XP_061514678.1 transmembrane protein 164 isoform X1 [Anopheles gambiae]XP_061514679.1 transmembrane protein 164 isoform X1 [Anopheles gambiae]XP_061514680.1 transmembrane protein 164 isoform X1 [Anopheles gambiae]XP_061514681.1 transmembrane protein 164 isoform X1 [Anopheles gambiae]XP_06151468